jgi:threonylcarbamoyladenosine tRNA methylthiotransferase MtaB
VRRLIDNGYREIVISGIHVGHYGVDTSRAKSGVPPFRLWHLFRRLDRIPGNWRMRLSSIEANEVDDEFIAAAADCEHLCHQFHPALQSGSDTVLERMRRRYRVGRFLEKLEKMRAVLPDVAFTTDVIVGFPGETEAEFEETLETCRRAGFMKIHAFPFSPRRGTPAATYPNQVAPEIRKLRMQRLSVVERELAAGYYRRWVGRDLQVLAERVCEDRPGWLRGTDRTYIPVELPGHRDEIGQFLPARGRAVSAEALEAER